MTIEEIFTRYARRICGVEPATVEEIAELEKQVGRTLPREYRAYLLRAGRKNGNLRFIQTHKVLQPNIEEAIAYHRPRRRGRHRQRLQHMLFFGDGDGCQDCGPALLALEPPDNLPKLAIDPDDPPVIGLDAGAAILLARTFTEYVLGAVPRRASV